jgi:hypothetical protein
MVQKGEEDSEEFSLYRKRKKKFNTEFLFSSGPGDS